jgi:hypothetical protein
MSNKRNDLWKEAEGRISQCSLDELRKICDRLSLPQGKTLSRNELVSTIIETVDDASRRKKPKNEEELKSNFRSLLDTVLTGGNLAETEEDPIAAKAKLKNMKDKCYCGVKGGKKDAGLWVTCSNQECAARFHHECLPWRMSDLDNFECPSCLILSNDPLNDVIQILFDASILISDHEYTFKMSYEQYSKMVDDVNIGVEVRSIKLDGEHFYEQTWPDKATLKLNGKVLKEIKPLHQNSSLKKRRDEKLFNRQNLKVGPNTLSINYQNIQDGKNTKLKQDPKYVFIVVLVRKISVEELSMRIRNLNRLSVETCKEFIKEKFLANKDLEINEIKVNLIDNISFTHIKFPARGLYCDHVPCFSLDYFLKSMENNYTRKWACPLCKKRCNKLIVDSYLETIIEQAKKKNPDLENVFFLKNGDVVFKSEIIEEPEAPQVETKAKATPAAIKPPQDKPVDSRHSSANPPGKTSVTAPPKKDKAKAPVEKEFDPANVCEILSVTSEEEKKRPSKASTAMKQQLSNKKKAPSEVHTPNAAVNKLQALEEVEKDRSGENRIKVLHSEMVERTEQSQPQGKDDNVPDLNLDEYSPRTVDNSPVYYPSYDKQGRQDDGEDLLPESKYRQD